MESEDQEYAARLQHEDDHAAMMNSHSGKAVLLVKDIIALVQTTNESHPSLNGHKIESVSSDDLVWFAKQMLGLQKEFAESKLPTAVDVGYHYTEGKNLPHIRTHGLLTKGDRKAKSVASAKDHGTTFGDG